MVDMVHTGYVLAALAIIKQWTVLWAFGSSEVNEKDRRLITILRGREGARSRGKRDGQGWKVGWLGDGRKSIPQWPGTCEGVRTSIDASYRLKRSVWGRAIGAEEGRQKDKLVSCWLAA